MTKDHDIKDIDLAEKGRLRIEWAGMSAPVLAKIQERFSREKPLEGVRLSACLHITTETALLLKALKAGGAIIITASHNPAVWNGLKYKNEYGSSASDEITARIEDNISQAFTAGKVNRLPLADARKQGLVQELDLDPVYFKQITGLVDLEAIRQAGLKLVVHITFIDKFRVDVDIIFTNITTLDI